MTAHAITAKDDRTMFGFWLYLMTDLVLFASLFATFAVLRNSIHDGPSGKEIFELNFVLWETIVLLVSSFTAGLALLYARTSRKAVTVSLLAISLLLGAVFVGMELYEFGKLVDEGYDWQRSAFLSAYFTLVGTHGLHILAGILWGSTMLIQIIRFGLNANVVRRLSLWSLFWHFLDIVWIFIFTIVYLVGVL